MGHTLDILDFILGPIEAVRAFVDNQARAYPPKDIVTGAFRFASGVYGSGAWCFGADCDEEGNEIAGFKGRITFSTFSPLSPPAGRPRCPSVSSAAAPWKNSRSRTHPTRTSR